MTSEKKNLRCVNFLLLLSVVLINACVQGGAGLDGGTQKSAPVVKANQDNQKKKVFVKPATGMIVLNSYSEINLSNFVRENPDAAYFSVNSENMVVVLDYDEASENPIVKVMNNPDSKKHLVIAYGADGNKIGSQEF